MGFSVFMIDDVIQCCLAYCVQVSMSNRLYDCTIVPKCICIMLCVIAYNKIYIKKLYCARRSLFLCDLAIHCSHQLIKSLSLCFPFGRKCPLLTFYNLFAVFFLSSMLLSTSAVHCCC